MGRVWVSAKTELKFPRPMPVKGACDAKAKDWQKIGQRPPKVSWSNPTSANRAPEPPPKTIKMEAAPKTSDAVTASFRKKPRRTEPVVSQRVSPTKKRRRPAREELMTMPVNGIRMPAA